MSEAFLQSGTAQTSVNIQSREIITLLPAQELIIPGLVFSTMPCKMLICRLGNPTDSPDTCA
jgi:hypothetical protein